jgi:hypothetical protein
MRGHEAIIAMRQQRQAPKAVFVGDIGVDVNWNRFEGAFPSVEIKDSDRVEQLDLRWAVGLELRLSFFGKDHANAVMDAFLKANPKRVICSTFKKITNAHGLPVPELLEIKDTEGVMTWPQ